MQYGTGYIQKGAAIGAEQGKPLGVPVSRDGVPIGIGMNLWDTNGELYTVQTVWSEACIDIGGNIRVTVGCEAKINGSEDSFPFNWWNCYANKP